MYPFEALRSTLSPVLKELPNLTEIFISRLDDGSIVAAMDIVFSVSTLQALEIYKCPWLNTAYDSERAPAPPLLRHFRFRSRRQPWYRYLSKQLSIENNSLWHILEQMQENAESLCIPGNTARIASMAAVDWPRLQQLKLYGLHPAEPAVPVISVLSHAPNLRSLSLTMATLQDETPFLVWPPHYTCDVDLASLKSFTISFPSPDDLIFAKLPDTLQHIAFKDTPRVYHHRHILDAPVRLVFPIPTCSQLLKVFGDIVASRLESLEVAYRVDASEWAMWRLLSEKFTSLSSLEVHRYRSIDSEEGPADPTIIPVVSLQTVPCHYFLTNVCSRLALRIRGPP